VSYFTGIDYTNEGVPKGDSFLVANELFLNLEDPEEDGCLDGKSVEGGKCVGVSQEEFTTADLCKYLVVLLGGYLEDSSRCPTTVSVLESEETPRPENDMGEEDDQVVLVPVEEVVNQCESRLHLVLVRLAFSPVLPSQVVHGLVHELPLRYSVLATLVLLVVSSLLETILVLLVVSPLLETVLVDLLAMPWLALVRA